MKKISTIAAIAAIVMTSCQKNETIDGPQSGNGEGAIKFGTIAPQTRANTLYTGTSSLLQDGQTFKVWGVISGGTNDGTVYLGAAGAGNAKEVAYNASTGEWSYESPKFWPSTNMHFLAYHSENKVDPTAFTTGASTDPKMTWTNFTVGTDVSKHDDLLVAGLANAEKPNLNGSTVLTFKHAMTQVVFSAQLYTGSKLKVNISEVELYNVANQGTLEVSAKGLATDPNDPSERTDGNAVINWTSFGTPDKSFKVDKIGKKDATAALTLDGTAAAYTYPVTSLTNYQEGAMMMVPHTFNAWDAKNDQTANLYDAGGNLQPTQAGGAFIRVRCQIIDGETGIYLWGKDATSRDLFIPVSSLANEITEWKWGKKINYVITFGDPGSGSGGGGWDGGTDNEGNPDPDEPNNPVLIPITLNALLTDWDEYGVYLQTVNLSSATNNLSIESIKSVTDQFKDEVVSNPAKIYAASIKVTSANTVQTGFNIQSILDAFNAEPKFMAGSTITFDFGANNNGNVFMTDDEVAEGIISTEDGKGLYYIKNASGTWTVTKYDDLFGTPAFLSSVKGSKTNTLLKAGNQEKFVFAGAQYNNGITFPNWAVTANYDMSVTNNKTTWDLAGAFTDNVNLSAAFNNVGEYIILDFSKMKFLDNPATGAPISGITIKVDNEFGIGASVEEAKNGGPLTKSMSAEVPTYTITKPGYVYIVRKIQTAFVN